MFAHCDHAHAERGGHAGDPAPDASQADQAESRSRNLEQVHSLRPHRFLSPNVRLLQDGGLGNLFGQRKDQREYVFGYDRAMNLPGIREDHVAIDQLRK